MVSRYLHLSRNLAVIGEFLWCYCRTNIKEKLMAYQQLGQMLSFTELECSQHPDTGSRHEPHKSSHTFQRPCHGSGSHWPIHIRIAGGKTCTRTVSTPSTSFYLVSNIPSKIHTHSFTYYKHCMTLAFDSINHSVTHKEKQECHGG